MKKSLITTGLIWIGIVSFAQPSVRERSIGRVLATQEEIIAKEYIFPEYIFHLHVDTISKSITVQLRGLSANKTWLNNRGKLVFYDLTDEKVKWSKNIAYQKSRIQQVGNTIIVTAGGLGVETYSLNIENGKKKWKVENNIHLVDPIAHIGIGYQYAFREYSNTIEGIDLKNGKVLWQRELNREYGWNDMFQLNDSTWMIVASGLRTVNIYDGTGWSYNTVTGKKDYKAATAFNVAGLALGLMTGTFIINTGHDLVRDLVSNVYSDSTEFYFASKEVISRIRKNDGTAKWWHSLPEDLASKSSIFARGDTLYMINYGYAFMGNRQINFGTPFFAAFNKEYGEQIFFHKIDTKKNPILDFRIENDHILLIFKDRIEMRSFIDGSSVFEKTLNNYESGELIGFVGNHLYINIDNSSMTKLALSDVSKNYIITGKDKVLIFNAELNITGEIDLNQMYVAHLRVNDYMLVTKDNQTFILDADNNKVAEMGITFKSFLVGNSLYSIHGKSFFEIDLTNIIGKN